MKDTFKLWKDIIANPFEGFKGLNDNTKIIWPLLTIIVLFLISTSLLIPILSSDEYSQAIVRAQVTSAAEKGNPMSNEQIEAMSKQMTSPMIKNITLVSSFVGGLITFMAITLLVSLILKLFVSSVKKDKVKFSLILKIILFTTIIAMVQSLLKAGITITGNWERVLSRVNETSQLQFALTSPISLAALFDLSSLGDSLYMLLDAFTDIFNWIYYIFLYAGLKIVAELDKKKAMIITVVIALISIAIGFAFTLIS